MRARLDNLSWYLGPFDCVETVETLFSSKIVFLKILNVLLLESFLMLAEVENAVCLR